MKLTLKEAYTIATKTLPGHRVEVEVSYGVSRWGSDKLKLKWSINATSDTGDGYYSENDEIFSIALAKVSAEVMRARMKPAEDIEVEQGEDAPPEDTKEQADGVPNATSAEDVGF